MYIRSTDKGVTFSAPLKLNTDTTTRAQWQPNLSVSDTGSSLLRVVRRARNHQLPGGQPGRPVLPNVRAQVHRQRRHLARRYGLQRRNQPASRSTRRNGTAELSGRLRLWLRNRQQPPHFMGRRARDYQRPIPAGCLLRQGPTGALEASHAETWFLSRCAASLMPTATNCRPSLPSPIRATRASRSPSRSMAIPIP